LTKESVEACTHTKKRAVLTKSAELKKILADNAGSLTKQDKTVINPQKIILNGLHSLHY